MLRSAGRLLRLLGKEVIFLILLTCRTWDAHPSGAVRAKPMPALRAPAANGPPSSEVAGPIRAGLPTGSGPEHVPSGVALPGTLPNRRLGVLI